MRAASWRWSPVWPLTVRRKPILAATCVSPCLLASSCCRESLDSSPLRCPGSHADPPSLPTKWFFSRLLRADARVEQGRRFDG